MSNIPANTPVPTAEGESSMNRAQRRAAAKRAKQKPTNNRKGTKGRKTQVVPVMQKVETKFGTITVPSGKYTKIEHTPVIQKEVRTKWDVNKKKHEAQEQKNATTETTTELTPE